MITLKLLNRLISAFMQNIQIYKIKYYLSVRQYILIKILELVILFLFLFIFVLNFGQNDFSNN